MQNLIDNQTVLFINPPNVPFSSKGILIEPIDTLSLASYIKNVGYSVQFLDMDIKNLLAHDLETYFINKCPSVIVIVFDYHIPLHNIGANQEIKKISTFFKEKGSIVILGGKAATFYSKEKLAYFEADIFIKYDMETPLENILNTIKIHPFSWFENLGNINNISYFCNNKYHENKKTNYLFELDRLSIPDRTLINLDDYIDVRTILSSRGCNLKCSFCHVPGFWGNWKKHTVEHVVEEIELLYKKFNSKKILFLDDNAMAQPKRLAQIANQLKEKEIKVALGCLGTILSFKKEFLKDMYDGGFRWIHYGAESGDDTQLAKMGKRINSNQILDVVNETKQIGFRVRTSWILDMPDLDEEGILKTENMILNHGADEIRLHFLTLRLGSLLYERHLIETAQFIHNSKPNLNLSKVSNEFIQQSVNRILNGLTLKGYTIIKDPNDFIDIENLSFKNKNLKIVSLCPLRYGLGWKY